MAWQPRVFNKCSNAQTEHINSFTVVTYNFLAQKYIDKGAHHYCHPEHRTWQRRWQRLEDELLHYHADVLCLQEVEEPVFYEQLTPLLAKQQMQGIYRPRQKDGYGPPEGVAFFFRTSCFELVKSRKIRLGDCVTGSGPFWQQVQQRGEGPVLALLKHRDTGKVILAGSVHLYFHPEWPDIKLAQAVLLCSQAVAMIEEEGMEVADVPVVFGGDWNSLWRKYRPDVYDTKIPKSGFLTSGVYSLLTSSQGTVDKGHHEHPATKHKAYKAMSKEVFTTSGLKLQSAHAAGNEGREPPLTTQTDSFMGCLDYIWLSQSHWHVTHTLSMPYDVDKGPEPQTVGFGPIPDKEFPSDHLAMGCRIALLE